MTPSRFPLRCALMAAALAQLFPVMTEAAEKKEAEDNAIKVCEDCPDIGGWSGWLQGGVNVQSHDDWHFGRYTGLEKSGGSVDADGAVQFRGKDGLYLRGNAVDLGLDSRDLAVEGGKQGKYGVAVEYDQIPNFRDNTTTTHLKTERDRTGIKFTMIPSKGWEVVAKLSHEEKDGTRDQGATFGFSQTTILPVSFNYTTDDIGLTLGYTGKKLQAQLAYTGSFFKDGQDAIVWNNPFPTPLVATGRIAETPDNQFHQLSANVGYQMTERTRIGAQYAIGYGTQKASFLPYTINPLVATSPLPTSSLDGKVDTTNAKLMLSSRPTAKLRVDASYTYSDRANKTPVNAYDYVLTDQVWQSTPCTAPCTPVPITRQNTPYSFEQKLLRLKAGYRLPSNADLSAGFDYDQINRTYLQVTDTKDQTFWAKLGLHPVELLETTLKVSHAQRNASSYVPLNLQNPQLGNLVYPENPLIQAFEMADRTRDKIGFGFAVNPRENLTLGLDLDYYKDHYGDMVLGLKNAKGLTYTPSLTYAFSQNLTTSAYYTYEKLSSNQDGLEWLTPSATPPGFFNIPWSMSDSNLTQTYGLNATWKAIPKKLDLGMDLVYTDFTGKISYTSAGATDLPDLTSTMTAIGVHGSYRLKESWSLRAGCWYERFKETDWAKNGSVTALPSVLSLGAAPLNVNTTLVSLSARYDFK